MITREMIAAYRASLSIGDTLMVIDPSKTRETGPERHRVIAIYKRFAIVTNGKYNFAVNYSELIRREMGQTDDNTI